MSKKAAICALAFTQSDASGSQHLDKSNATFNPISSCAFLRAGNNP